MNDKPIIIIGGASGVGKTTLSRQLSERLSIDHRLGSGFIREILRSQTDKVKQPYLFEKTFNPTHDESLKEHYYKQTEYLESPIIECVKRAKSEGTSLIIEGSNIDPEIINKCDIDLYILLFIEKIESHKGFVAGNTHRLREVSEIEFKNVRQIQSFLLERAKNITDERVIIIENSQMESSVNIITQIVKNKMCALEVGSHFIYPSNNSNLLVEYQKRFDYEFNSIGRRWQMLTVLIAVSGFSFSFYDRINYKLSLSIFNILTGIFSIAYWIQIRNRAYSNDLRLKEISELLGIKGLIHIKRKERLLRFNSVSVYAIMFMVSVVVVWILMILSEVLNFRLI